MPENPKYPEHEKLAGIADESHTIGAFLDMGLPEMGLMLYQHVTRDCECSDCENQNGKTCGWHTEREKETIVDGRVQITNCRPAMRTIQSILAEYFDIDQSKIDAEKEQMLEEMRALNT